MITQIDLDMALKTELKKGGNLDDLIALFRRPDVGQVDRKVFTNALPRFGIDPETKPRSGDLKLTVRGTRVSTDMDAHSTMSLSPNYVLKILKTLKDNLEGRVSR